MWPAPATVPTSEPNESLFFFPRQSGIYSTLHAWKSSGLADFGGKTLCTSRCWLHCGSSKLPVSIPSQIFSISGFRATGDRTGSVCCSLSHGERKKKKNDFLWGGKVKRTTTTKLTSSMWGSVGGGGGGGMLRSRPSNDDSSHDKYISNHAGHRALTLTLVLWKHRGCRSDELKGQLRVSGEGLLQLQVTLCLTSSFR